ncbi:hypothetical protein NQ317_018050 [Molorchus minor]|uniref:Uncharacterized protein n=1 Tax=Molorchus minor TaxID=1323400 RepID=A0ABQ9JMI2_9CUCU|nr:hypothetical protein NQ317_018050 [Molorchus minor]
MDFSRFILMGCSGLVFLSMLSIVRVNNMLLLELAGGAQQSIHVTKNVKTMSENILLAYLMQQSKVVKSSTLWSIYSMLKCLLNIREGIDVRKFLKLVPFLEKSKVFTCEQIDSFLKEANDNKYLKAAYKLGETRASRACHDQNSCNLYGLASGSRATRAPLAAIHFLSVFATITKGLAVSIWTGSYQARRNFVSPKCGVKKISFY